MFMIFQSHRRYCRKHPQTYLQNFLHGKCWEEIAGAQGVDTNCFNRHCQIAMRGGCPDFYCSGSLSTISRLILKTCQKGRGLVSPFYRSEARIQSSRLAKGHLAQKGSAGLAPAVCRGVGRRGSRKEPRGTLAPRAGRGVPMKGQISLRTLLRTTGIQGPFCPLLLCFLGAMKAGQYGEKPGLSSSRYPMWGLVFR